jgi:predicted permease
MSNVRAWLSRLAGIFNRGQRDRELAAELESHLEMQIEDNVRRGMGAGEARRVALIQSGGIESTKEKYRERRGLPLVERFLQDLRYGVRTLRSNRGFTAIAVLTLALGIGANTAIFSIVEAVALRPLPFKDANRLVDLTEYKLGGVDSGGVPYPDYVIWKQQNTVFEETAAYFLINASNDVALGGPFSTERERYSTVTNSFFSILGVQPALGHGFSASDEIPGGPRVFLISDAVWHGVYGGDFQAIGKTYLLDGENFTLIGVMPSGFDFPKGCGIWVPISTLGTFGLNDRISHPYHVLGRLRHGTSLAQAAAQIETIQAGLAKAYPKTDADWHVRAQPLLNEIIGNVQTSLFVLLGAVGFILLIACVNVANLMLARATSREQEYAIRSALGASRVRLAQQALTESLLIVILSAALALVFANWSLRAIVALSAGRLPRFESFHLNLPVLAFAAGMSLLTTVLVGMAPTLQLSGAQFRESLAEGPRSGGTGIRTQSLRNVLVVVEVALTISLLCGAGLMLRGFVELNRVNPGFRTEHLLTMKIALPSGEYPKTEQTSVYLDRLLERLRALPGVESVAAATTLPLSGESDWGTFLIAGRSAPDWTKASAADWRGVSLDYFHTLGIPLLRGREFTPADAKNQNAIIINEAMARKFWPASDPIGQRILNRDQQNPLEIIGIVGNTKGLGLDAQAKPEMYTIPRGLWYTFLVLRISQEPSRMVSTVREEVAALDRGVPIYQVASMDQLLSASVASHRFNLFLLGLFAVLALVLAMVGIYGVLAFGVSRRRHEIGIRMALGALPQEIMALVVWQGMRLVLVGTVLGILMSVALTRLMSTLLYGVEATDPLTFACVAALLAGAALAACYAPARRAMRVDPMTALRYE